MNSLIVEPLYLSRPDYISPLDDLAFDMYQDPEVAQIIRKLEKKKQDAVLGEWNRSPHVNHANLKINFASWCTNGPQSEQISMHTTSTIAA